MKTFENAFRLQTHVMTDRIEMHLLAQRSSCKRAIIAVDGKARVLQLEISSRGKIIEDLLADRAIVLEACHQGTRVDVIEWVVECPLIFCIINLELAIWWIADCRVSMQSNAAFRVGDDLLLWLYGT